MKRIILINLLCVALNVNAADGNLKNDVLTKDACELTAHSDGYLTMVTTECGYTLGKEAESNFAKFTKQCVVKYGNNFVFNNMMAGVHEAKQNFNKYDRNEVCSGVFKAFHKFFD